MKVTSSSIDSEGTGQVLRKSIKSFDRETDFFDNQEGASREIDGEETILLQRTLRSGQSVRYQGHVVILGDVNPGAEVVAGGNIIVMGHLRGVAHAGAGGNESALIAAFRLNPTQLRIANHITRAPDGENPDPEQPEVARISGGTVIIERYHPGGSKYFSF